MNLRHLEYNDKQTTYKKRSYTVIDIDSKFDYSGYNTYICLVCSKRFGKIIMMLSRCIPHYNKDKYIWVSITKNSLRSKHVYDSIFESIYDFNKDINCDNDDEFINMFACDAHDQLINILSDINNGEYDEYQSN